MQFTIHSEKIAFKGFFRVKEYQLSHELFRGGMSRTITREIFDRSPVAAVLPFDPIRQEVLLIEQFRVGALQAENPWMLELIAGMIEEGESAQDMAIRESQEEAGITIHKLTQIYQYFTSPGGTNEFLTMFCAEVDLQHAGGIFGCDQEEEDIKVHILTLDKAFALLHSGKIINAATIIALQWLESQRGL